METNQWLEERSRESNSNKVNTRKIADNAWLNNSVRVGLGDYELIIDQFEFAIIT